MPKQIILCFFSIILIFFACSSPQARNASGPGDEPRKSAPAMIMLEKKDHGREIRIRVGDEVRVKLQFTGGTGYQWHLDDGTMKYFELVEHQTEPVYQDNRVGGPMWGIWRLKSIKTGPAEIAMDYFRVWEGRSKAMDHFLIKVNILE